MHRVVHQMAQSVDNSGGALRRSAESKGMDFRSAAIVAGYLATLIKEHAGRILHLVHAGRKEEPMDWSIQGLDEFGEEPLEVLMEQASVLDSISIPSATFKIKWLYTLASRILGDSCSREEMSQILEDLQENITNDQFNVLAALGPPEGGVTEPPPAREEDDDAPVS
jgi:hypothetical protein